MTPEQIKLAVQLGIAALVLVAAAAAGWTLNGWRLGTALEHAQRERDQALDQGKVLAQGVQACSAGVEEVQKVASDAIATSKGLLAKAQELAAGAQQQVRKIDDLLAKQPPPGAGCEAAWKEIETLRKAGGPR